MKAPTEQKPKHMSPAAMKEIVHEEEEGEESLGAPQQHRSNGPYQGTTWELLNTSAYKHNKEQPLWEVKDLHIGEHHKMKHLDLHHRHHKGPIHHLLTGQRSAEGGMEMDDSGSPIPVDISVYSRKGAYGNKSKCRKGKKSGMSPFKGI
jgi:hypothetical protein